MKIYLIIYVVSVVFSALIFPLIEGFYPYVSRDLRKNFDDFKKLDINVNLAIFMPIGNTLIAVEFVILLFILPLNVWLKKKNDENIDSE